VIGEWQFGDEPRDATLRRIVAALRRWEPARIILFGSHARGDARPDSDLDVLVILPDVRVVTRRTLVDMRLAIGEVPVDYDLLITSHADFEWRRDYVGTIEYPAAHEGVDLYAA
jgi:predicted nucleotidyltransferase